MNIFTVEVTCDICGGPGLIRQSVADARWFGAKVSHTNPRVCADYLAKERRRIEVDKKNILAAAQAL